ncbi:MAG: hypothetical protein KVP17_003173 [Porospora cf. gigantea B]|nr:MAG: hypothetical protein KVP17_003173 [Porospora cf. gigantea B]
MGDEDCGIGEDCGICFQDLQGERGELCALSPCGHVWHSKCIVDWFQKSPGSTCPLCRKAGTLVELLLKIDYRGWKKQVNTKNAEMSKTKSQLKKTEKALKETVRVLGARDKKLSKKQDEIKRLHARCGNLADGKKAAESKLQQKEAAEKVDELRRRVRIFNHDQECQPPKPKKRPAIAKLRRSARLRRAAVLQGGNGD